jgi:hypothetical protein
MTSCVCVCMCETFVYISYLRLASLLLLLKGKLIQFGNSSLIKYHH